MQGSLHPSTRFCDHKAVRSRNQPYQSSALTAADPAEVFAALRASLQEGATVVERGTGYVVVGSRAPVRGAREVAVAASVLGVMVVLGLTALTPLFVVLLPLPLITAVPFLLERHERVAVAAAKESGGTTVSLHGRASPELRTTLSGFLDGLSLTKEA
jgi:hypothetical protein